MAKATSKKTKPAERKHALQDLALDALAEHLENHLLPKAEVEAQKVAATLIGVVEVTVQNTKSHVEVSLDHRLGFGDDVRGKVKVGVKLYGDEFRQALDSSIEQALKQAATGRLDVEHTAGNWTQVEVETNVNAAACSRSAADALQLANQMTQMAHILMALGAYLNDQFSLRKVGATFLENARPYYEKAD